MTSRNWVAAEALESRRLLAGNVTAQFAGGNLTLTGDAGANQIEITIVNGDVVVKGLTGTTINNVASFTAVDGGTRIAGTITANMGAGDDTVLLSSGISVGGTVRLALGEGSNRAGIDQATIDGQVAVIGGKSIDRFWTRNATLGARLDVNLGQGNDEVFLEDTQISGVTVLRGGNGSNSFAFQDTTFNDRLVISGGKGNQQAVFQDSTLNGFNFHGGKGQDFILMEDTDNQRATNIRFGKSADTFVTQGDSDFTGKVRIHGGKDGAKRQISTSSAFESGAKFKKIPVGTVTAAEITARTTAAGTGAIALGEANRTFFLNQRDPVELTLTLDAPTAGVVQGNGTRITKNAAYTISGVTKAGATVKLSKDPDGLFDDATTTAGADGRFTIAVTLTRTATNLGANHFVVQATDAVGRVLAQDVDVHLATGSVVQMVSTQGTMEVELLDTAAPVTVANFKSYLTQYVNSIIHRSARTGTGGKFIIQGGGFKLSGNEVVDFPAGATIANEFNSANPNVRGTLSMALPSGQPNGGSSEWFINMVDNPSLNSAQHTVFGRVIGNGMAVAEAIHALPSSNISAYYDIDRAGVPRQGALNETPLSGYTEFSQALTGTVSGVSGSTTVTGVGTSFTTQLEVGSKIKIGTQTYTVNTITSNTSLTVNVGISPAFTNATASKNVAPVASQFVKFTTFSELLTA